jgi:hypothetical protein
VGQSGHSSGRCHQSLRPGSTGLGFGRSFCPGDSLTADKRAQLTEVVHGYTRPCDVVAAREGLAWLRERYRERGDQPPF